MKYIVSEPDNSFTQPTSFKILYFLKVKYKTPLAPAKEQTACASRYILDTDSLVSFGT